MSDDLEDEASKEKRRKERHERKKLKKREVESQKNDVLADDLGHTDETRKKTPHKKRKHKELDTNGDSGIPSTNNDDNQDIKVDLADISQSSERSPFYNQTSSFYLPISPICLGSPLEGVCAEHLSPLILTYHPLFRAVVLTYSNVRLGEKPTTQSTNGAILARSIDEYAVSFIWVTVDFLLFKPQKGDDIEGHINLQDKSHIGLVCWNLFNASIERTRIPNIWTWKSSSDELSTENNPRDARKTKSLYHRNHEIENANGFYEDGNGTRLERKIGFQVKDAETSAGRDKGFLSIEGTLLSMDDEAKLIEAEKASAQSRRSNRRQNLSRRFANGRHNHSESGPDIDPQNTVANNDTS